MDSVGILTNNVSSMISVIPQRGSLSATDKPTNVQVFFRARKEVKIEQQPILRCQVRADWVAGLGASCCKEESVSVHPCSGGVGSEP